MYSSMHYRGQMLKNKMALFLQTSVFVILKSIVLCFARI